MCLSTNALNLSNITTVTVVIFEKFNTFVDNHIWTFAKKKHKFQLDLMMVTVDL